MPLPFCIDRIELGRSPCSARMPFRFGAVTIHEAELLTCRVRVHDERRRDAIGWSADFMVPRWFRKDTDATPQQDVEELFGSAVAAAQVFAAQPTAPAFRLWRGAFAARVESAPQDAPDLLLRGFGTALVERAVLDAACRLAELPFAAALGCDVFGFIPGDVHAELASWQWQDELPAPSERIVVRHTVGMLDVLCAADIPIGERIDDGLPQALDEDIAAYGLSWFKIKIGAGFDADRRRLLELAAFFAERDLAPNLSVDGNEQFDDLGQLADVLEAVARERHGRELLQRVACIEQPLERAATFDASRHRDLARVHAFAPLMLDEADAVPQSFVRALELGYRGVSVKNCKGVFRALCNFGICKRGAGRFQSGEDLTNVGILSLQQDLVTASVLGLPHVERNGHHYFRGLDHLPPQLVDDAQRAHPDVYGPLGDDSATLRIRQGRIDVTSLLTVVGYGHAFDGCAEGLQVVAGS